MTKRSNGAALSHGLGLLAACFLAACASDEASTSERTASPLVEDQSRPIHAFVFIPDGVRSELYEESSGLLWAVPKEDVGEAGWWLVTAPPSYLDDLAVREGLRWRRLPDGYRVQRPLPDELGGEQVMRGGGAAPNFLDPGESCNFGATPEPNTFCPYDTLSSAEPGISCNRPIISELNAAAVDYPPVNIGGTMTTYVQLVTLGTTHEGRLIKGLRVGKLWSVGGPVRQLVVYGAQHAKEWITSELTMRLIRHYASKFRDGDTAVRALLADRAILFVPVANPDGYAKTHLALGSGGSRAWRANAQVLGCSMPNIGTDPNRNFPMSFGQPGSLAACVLPDNSSYSGSFGGSAQETGSLLAALTNNGLVGQYRTWLALNTHAYGNFVIFTTGLSNGFYPCTTSSNCIAPDLGAFHRHAGTERVPRLRDEEIPTVPYRSAQVHTALYEVSGDSMAETVYGSLPNSAPRFLTISTELTHTACTFYAERLPAAQITNVFNNYQSFVSTLASELDELETGSTQPSFDLPLLHRRQPSGAIAEYPRFRVAARSTLSGVTITPNAGGPGVSALDDVLAGVYYNEWRWTPDSPYIVPGRLTVCAQGANCATSTIDGVTTTFNLCDPSRFTSTGGWSFVNDASGGPQNECFWRFSHASSSNGNLTSTDRKLTNMSQARLVFSFNWMSAKVRIARVVVSSNGFSSCSDTNYGNCRIVRRFDQSYGGYLELGNAGHRTEVIDVSDFDGQNKVKVRFEVHSTSGSPAMNELAIYEPVFVGWYVP